MERNHAQPRDAAKRALWQWAGDSSDRSLRPSESRRLHCWRHKNNRRADAVRRNGAPLLMPGEGRRALYGCRRQRGRRLSGPARWRVRCATGGTHHGLLKGAALVRGARDERGHGRASEGREGAAIAHLAGVTSLSDASCAALRCAALRAAVFVAVTACLELVGGRAGCPAGVPLAG